MTGGDTRKIRLMDPGYPAPLKELKKPPSELFIRGAYQRRDILAVAVVGSRTPTAYGRTMSRRLAGELAERGVTIISGLARGVDTAAHLEALEAGGRTIAVLGCGMDVDYPRGSAALRERIAANGALVTEFEPGTAPLPGNFPRRNRVISGLSRAVVVVEAAVRSGSLITARWAADQGRDVMAVPGRADSTMSAGPIKLIRDGAVPVTGAADILDALGIELPETGSGPSAGSGLLDRLSSGALTAGELAASGDCSLKTVMAELTSLEIEGKIHRDPGGRYSLRSGGSFKTT
jgi:DNA processing protein